MTLADRLVRHPIAVITGEPRLEVAGTLTFSAVDGPGNRFVLFLQGCNFDCVACHNPSTIGRCDACGACVTACPHGALTQPESGVVAWDEAACDRCRACIAPCPIDADPAVRLVTVGEVVEEIRAVAPFIGGITVTGGEPTIQLEALHALFVALKADPDLSRLTTLVDSNGTLPRRGWDRLAPVMDGAMLDLKAASDRLHQEITGHSNQAVIDSIRHLGSIGKLAEVRLLVIEGITDPDDHLREWARLVGGVDPGVPVRVMAFRHLGTRAAARQWPETTQQAVERTVRRLSELGLHSVSV